MHREFKSKRQTGGPGMIRTFICIEIPVSIKKRLDELEQKLKRMDAQVSWVKSSNIHLTLKFLGEIPQSKVASICSVVERAVSDTDPFDIEVGGAGCFPNARNPRVLWVGLTGIPDEMARLHAAIENGLLVEGFPKEGKKFSPHLTIGRFRSPKNADKIIEELTSAGFANESYRASEVIVMRSDLNPGGSVYTPLARMGFLSKSRV